jgi:putative phosphoribosyl transferase
MAETLPIDTTMITVPIHRLHGPAMHLRGRLALPPLPEGLVLIAAGHDSNRKNLIDTALVSTLHESWIGTLLVDLNPDPVCGPDTFDLPVLAERLLAAVRAVDSLEYTRHLPLGFFGTRAGGGAAILAATREPRVAAVVSHCGWPSLSQERLEAVRAPTLLIVDSTESDSLPLNERAIAALRCEKRMVVVPGTPRHGEPPDPIGEATWLATEWFAEHLDR